MNPLVPQLLERLRGGDQSVLDQLTVALYDELRRIAARYFRGERPGYTLQATALVHEAYVKLCGQPEHHFQDRVHFLAVASRVMRQVLVDHARARAAQKRGGEEPKFEVEAETGSSELVELLDLDGALDRKSVV